MPKQIKHNNILDGYILIFKNFQVIKHLTKFWLPLNVNIQSVSTTYCRGSTTFGKGNTLLKVQFGNHLDHPVEIIIKHNQNEAHNLGNDVSNSSIEEHPGLPVNQMTKFYADIRESFICAINHSAKKLGCWELQCCKTYESIIRNRSCNCNKRRFIDAVSAPKFGQCFFQDFKVELLKRDKERNLDLYFVIRRLGQNISDTNAELSFKGYRLDLVNELLIHFARDYYVPGHILLWDTVLLRKKYGQTPYMEFYPGLIKGHGNLYYDLDEKGDQIDIKEWKFYTQLFKEVHNVEDSKGVAPFTRPLLKALFGDQKTLNDMDTLVNWIACLQNVLKSYECSNFLYCREEVIFSTLQPEEFSPKTVLEKFKNLLGQRKHMSKYYDIIKMENFVPYLHGFMDYLLEFIAQQISDMAAANQAKKIFLISEEKNRTACACEAVIAFAIYGQAVFRKNKLMFSKEIRDDLGLNKKYFREFYYNDEFRPNWTDYCVGLKGLKNISVVNDQVICQASFPLYRRQHTFALLSLTDQFNELINSFGNSVIPNDIGSRVADLFVQLLVEFSYMKYMKSITYTLESLMNQCFQGNKTLIPVTPKEYCNWLFDEQKQSSNLYYNHIVLLLHKIKVFMPLQLRIEFPKLVCVQLELRIIESKCILMVPCEEYKIFAIFFVHPQYCAFNNFDFFLSLDRNRVLHNLELLFNRWSLHKAPRSLFHDIVSECLGIILDQNLDIDLEDFLKTILFEINCKTLSSSTH